MYKITSAYISFNRQIEKIEKFISVLFISLIVLIVFAGTIARYFFDEALFGADRLATYLMAWLGFLGFQIGASKMRHIEIEAVKSRVNEKIRFLFNIISSFVASAFLFFFSYIAWQYASESRQLADTDLVLGIPLWWIILIIPLSFFISAVRYIFNGLLWLDVYGGRRKQEDIVKKQLL